MLESIITGGIALPTFLICTAVSLLLGMGTAFISMYKAKCTQSFAITLAVLPVVVQMVILLVNGNVGAGVAVAGAFSLVRFRSAPGTAREIGVIFLATGMGYIGLAVLFFVIVAAVLLLLTRFNFGGSKRSERILRITIPENLDYEGLFDDLFQKYAENCSLEKVKTSNMGTMYELQYRIVLKDAKIPKAFFDEIRCRNGNLNIVCGREAVGESL